MEKNIYNLFISELHDLLSAEQQIAAIIPRIIMEATSSELKKVFREHLKETRHQISRLRLVFKLLNLKPRAKLCQATKGLVRECKEMIVEFPPSSLRDAALISKFQRIKHYEISGYGTLRTFAKELDLSEIASILQDTLKEEGSLNKKLTKLAQGTLLTTGINHKAHLPIIRRHYNRKAA